jgi:hypothetical protein
MKKLATVEKEWSSKVDGLAATVSAMKVDTDAGYQEVIDYANEVLRPMLVDLDESFDDIIAHAHEGHKKAIAAKAKKGAPIRQALALAEELLDEWEEKRTVVRLELQAKADKIAARLAEAEGGDPSVAIAPAVMSEEVQASGIARKTNWGYRVVDETVVPEAYWTLNHKLIGQVVRREKEKTDIPGIEVTSAASRHFLKKRS